MPDQTNVARMAQGRRRALPISGKAPSSKAAPPPASATILQFAHAVPRSLSMTQVERTQAAAWAAHRAVSLGGLWWVETHLTDDGRAWLGVVTPSSRSAGRNEPGFAWVIERTGRGVELTRSRGWETRTFRTVTEALASIEAAERTSRTDA